MQKERSLKAIAQIIGGEGFSHHAANEVKRYWKRRVMSPRQARRITNKRKAFTDVAARKLDEADRIVLGAWISCLCKMSFDTGLRLGLMTVASEIEIEKEQAEATLRCLKLCGVKDARKEAAS